MRAARSPKPPMSGQCRARWAMVAAGLMGLAGCNSVPQTIPPGTVLTRSSVGLSLTMDSGSDRLKLFNPGEGDVDVATPVMLERQGTDGLWHSLGVALYAGPGCQIATTSTVTHLAARFVIEASPCLGTQAHGPGTFRYVVTLLPSGERVAGPTFTVAAVAG